MNVPRLFGVALALATVIGAASTVLIRVTSAWLGTPVPWIQAASGWVDWYLWALLTPLVVMLARAIPVQEERWGRAVAKHLVSAFVVASVELAFFAAAMSLYFSLFVGVELGPFPDRYISLIGRWLPLQMLIYALIVAVVSAVDSGVRARAREVRAARLETELSRSQLHALQSQVQPHFLFNTMNTISMAVREERNDEAVTMMAHLSGILRRSIEAAVRPETTLRREVTFIDHYLQLERYRMEDRLEVRWEVRREALDASIPTMLLQPLVENAVRHGLADLPEGGRITVRGTVDESGPGAPLLRLEVEDDGRGIEEEPAEGIGIRNVRRRLETQYGDRASLRLGRRAGGGTSVVIVMPIEPDPSPADP